MKCRLHILLLAGATVLAAGIVLRSHSWRAPNTAAERRDAQAPEQVASEPVTASAKAEGTPVTGQGEDEARRMDSELSAELRCLAEQDPVAAAARLCEVPLPLRPEFAAAIASAWGKSSPEAAAAWVREKLKGETRVYALLSLSADWATANPAAAAEGGMALLPEARQGEFLNTVAARWGKADANAALAWSERLPAGETRESLLAGIACGLAETSPLEAAGLVPLLAAGRGQDETALTVLLEWSHQDPNAAADWVKLFPAGHLRQEAVRNLAALWAEQSTQSGLPPSALLNWPEGQERDQAIRFYLDEVLELNAARGAEVLPGITNQELRQEETQRVMQHLLAQYLDTAQ